MTSRDEIIPCDCLLLKGKVVVNEESLTGDYDYDESSSDDDDDGSVMQSLHRYMFMCLYFYFHSLICYYSHDTSL